MDVSRMSLSQGAAPSVSRIHESNQSNLFLPDYVVLQARNGSKLMWKAPMGAHRVEDTL
jgi:hypothetical protein